jgi:hypothetical protein
MSNPINKINVLRSLYNAQNSKGDNNIDQELKEIKTELRIANDVKATDEATSDVKTLIGSAIGSPYLTDQPWYNKTVIYNSPTETNWKEVRSEEDNRRAAYNFANLKKLNIL